MRAWHVATIVVAIVVTAQSVNYASMSSVRRELRRMTGYVILSSDSVAEVIERRGEKHIRLLSGTTFKIDGLILGPLPVSDVIVFAKPLPEELKRQYSTLPASYLYSYKLLIDDEIVDASPSR